MNNEFYINERYARKVNNRCFIAGTLFGLGIALISPVVRLIHRGMDRAIRNDIKAEYLAEKEEE